MLTSRGLTFDLATVKYRWMPGLQWHHCWLWSEVKLSNREGTNTLLLSLVLKLLFKGSFMLNLRDIYGHGHRLLSVLCINVIRICTRFLEAYRYRKNWGEPLEIVGAVQARHNHRTQQRHFKNSIKDESVVQRKELSVHMLQCSSWPHRLTMLPLLEINI